MIRLLIHFAVFVLLSTLPLSAQVYTPRVTSDLLPDYTELSRFVDWHRWRGLPEAEKARAIWRFLCDYETGLFPVQGIYEDPDPGPEFAFFDERDVIKVLNVHGHGYCGLLSPTLDGVYAAAGFSDSRIFNMRENHHCVTEVFYDGGWHYFDMDLRGILLKTDGTVASLDEARTVPELWTDPPVKIEPFYPLDDKAKMFESFAPCFLTPMYHWYKNGHTMDFVLRPGESLTRWWQPQGGRWHHPWPNPGGFNLRFLTRKFNQEPRGLKSKHDGWSKWTHGNALFSYSPVLSESYEDFERGVYDCQGVKQTSRGVETAGDSAGRVSFEVRTPYIIVGRVYELDRPEKIDKAATLYYRSLGPATVKVSTDNGLTWSVVDRADHAGGKSSLVDLTPLVLGKYGFLVRFDLGSKSGLAELSLNTWCQLAPVSLPRVFKGANPLHFAAGDRYGHPTTVREIRLNLRDPDQLRRHLVSMNADYRPLRDRAKIKGELVLKVDSKPGTRIKWLTAGGYFHTYAGTKTVENRNAIYYSTAGPEGPWKKVAGPKVPEWVLSWHYGMDEDIILEEPAETVYLKYLGDPGLNQVWVYAHCLARSESSGDRVRVTHGYELEGRPVERTFELSRPGNYSIDCPGEPENRYIRFALESKPAAGD